MSFEHWKANRKAEDPEKENYLKLISSTEISLTVVGVLVLIMAIIEGILALVR